MSQLDQTSVFYRKYTPFQGTHKSRHETIYILLFNMFSCKQSLIYNLNTVVNPAVGTSVPGLHRNSLLTQCARFWDKISWKTVVPGYIYSYYCSVQIVCSGCLRMTAGELCYFSCWVSLIIKDAPGQSHANLYPSPAFYHQQFIVNFPWEADDQALISH